MHQVARAVTATIVDGRLKRIEDEVRAERIRHAPADNTSREHVDDEGDVSFEYDIEKNSDLAANLKGHLLLTTGDVDNNVHHAGTFRMAEALIRANKRFDFFMFPGQRHGYGDMSDYWFWLRAEYFVKHLLGDDEWNANLLQLQVEQPKTR